MIIDKEVEIKIVNSNKKYYNNLGYSIGKSSILVKIDDLPKGSHIKIKCICNICQSIKEIIYKNYILQISRGDYVCKDCCKNKTLSNYRLKIDDDFFKERTKKIKNTCLEKYGVDSYSKTNEYVNKIKETCISKYGVENVSLFIPTKEKKKNTFVKNYGETHFFKTPEFKIYIQTLFLKKYGVDNPFKDNNVKNLIRESKIKKGYWSGDNNYVSYRRKVDYLTKMNKSILFNNWLGYDYYDNEYIMENTLLNNNHNNYPSIDHKIPVLYGFINNIDVEYISDISNLCITKRYINSIKGSKIIKSI